jgi:hypothetical protein
MEQRKTIPVFAESSNELALAIFDAANRQPLETRLAAQAAAGILLRNLLVLGRQVPDPQERMQIALSGLVRGAQLLPEGIQVDQTTLQQLSEEQATVFSDIYQEAVAMLVKDKYEENNSLVKHYNDSYDDRVTETIRGLSEVYGNDVDRSIMSNPEGFCTMERDVRVAQAMQAMQERTA